MKKKSKHGINTGKTLKFGRTLMTYKKYSKDQHVILKYYMRPREGHLQGHLADAEIQEHILAECNEVVDDGGLRHNTEYHRNNPVMMSANKRKRWLLSDTISSGIDEIHSDRINESEDDLEDGKKYDFSMSLIQRETNMMPTTWGYYPRMQKLQNDCVEYSDSRLDIPHVRPNKSTYAFATDLRNAEKFRNGEQRNVRDERRQIRQMPHNVHSRGVQRKSQIPKKKERREMMDRRDQQWWDEHHDVHRTLNADVSAPEIRYEICSPQPLSACSTLSSPYSEHDQEPKALCKVKHVRKMKSQDLYFETLSGLDMTHDNEVESDLEEEEQSCGTDLDLRKNPFSLSDYIKTDTSPRKREKKSPRSGSFHKRAKLDLQSYEQGKGHVVHINYDNESPPTSSEPIREEDDSQTDLVIVDTQLVETTEDVELNQLELVLPDKSLTPSELSKNYGNSYLEGRCIPRCFALDLTQKETPNIPLSSNTVAILQESNQTMEINGAIYTKVLCHFKSKLPGSVLSDLNTIITEMSSAKPLWTDLGNFYNAMKSILRKHHSVETCGQEPLKPLHFSVLDKMLNLQVQSFSHTNARKVTEMSLSKVSPTEEQIWKCRPGTECDPEGFCGICYAEITDSESLSLKSCGHVFCEKCWHSHVSEQMKHTELSIKCPEFDCEVEVDKVTLLKLVSYSSYCDHMNRCLDRQIEADKSWMWCPHEKCGRITRIELSSGQSQTPTHAHCGCGQSWCWECKETPHWPATCSQARNHRKLMIKRGDDTKHSVSSDYFVLVPTKKCPQCKYPIEKNMGCPAMYCVMCHCSFCWQCLTPYSVHDYSVCSRKQIGETVVEISAADEVRLVHKYYIAAIHHHKQFLILTNHKIDYNCRILDFKLKKLHIEFPGLPELEVITKGHEGISSLHALALILKHLHFVLEHTLVFVGCGLSRKKHRVFLDQISILEIIVAAIDSVFTNKTSSNLRKTVPRLNKLVTSATATLTKIARLSANVQPSYKRPMNNTPL